MLRRRLVRDYKTHPHRSEAMIHPVADLSSHQRDHHLVARPDIALQDEKTEETASKHTSTVFETLAPARQRLLN